jgi:hypothetical protein
MSAQSMIKGASAQIEILKSTGNIIRDSSTAGRAETKLLALATFYWEGDEDWVVFVKKVINSGDRMFAEFDDEKNVTQYIQFKTGNEI